MTDVQRKILVTSALMYANGPLHLGHILEVIQTDIWCRFQRLRGHNCTYVCGDDAHGTPIMLGAEKRGQSPEVMIEEFWNLHRADYKDFNISVDNYYTTHSEENRELAEFIYEQLKARGDINTKVIEQAYDPEKEMFLPDRFVKGECPKCGCADQYGDNCEHCGATYDPTELKNPKSAVSGATPVLKQSEHYFFQLGHYTEMLRQWTEAGHLQEPVKNKLKEWLGQGLADWDISRDKPYFGFKIPGTEDKYFYVWLDAPIGYMASFKNLCNKGDSKLNFDEYWNKDSKTELYHFIGKDIIYFHGLFWPAMLHGANLRTPTAITAHGFLTVDGQKMSKSRGTFIQARTYLKYLDPEYLRYYFAAKLSNSVDDIDLNFEDFMMRVNADLVGKVVNIASRSAGFIYKKFDGMLSHCIAEPELLAALQTASDSIAEAYEHHEYSRAVRMIMELADSVNQYIDAEKPWALAKEEEQADKVHEVCSMALNLFRILMVYLKPILPVMAEKVEAFFNIEPLIWADVEKPLTDHRINRFQPLMQRIEIEKKPKLLLMRKPKL
jgi:methionyl-tRNA synthetase